MHRERLYIVDLVVFVGDEKPVFYRGYLTGFDVVEMNALETRWLAITKRRFDLDKTRFCRDHKHHWRDNLPRDVDFTDAEDIRAFLRAHDAAKQEIRNVPPECAALEAEMQRFLKTGE